MKIGIMLRHYDQHGGGVKVYTQGLLSEMLAMNTPHEFVLVYQNPKLIGTYSKFSHVHELAVKSKFKLIWDQVAMNRVAEREKLDLIFNPKYSLPLMADCKNVFVCHGLDWCVEPKWSKMIDRISHKFLIPRYAKKADAIIAVSETTRQHVIKYLGVPESHVHTIYHGIDKIFNKAISPQRLKEIRRLYKLPEKFFLYVGQIYPPKNFARLLQAYARVGPKLGISLVIAGEHRWLCGDELALVDKLKISSWVARPGWIDRSTLPALYAMAEALLLPSLYESFGIPILEAMSSGCPVVTANRHGTREIADEAAVLVHPEDIDSIANGMRQAVTDQELRHRVVQAGYERSINFSWNKCVSKTLDVFESVFK